MFESSYQYIPKNALIEFESDIPEILSGLEENILEFTATFTYGQFYKDYLIKIGKELESTAYYFGQQQGLETDRFGNPINLLSGIRARVFGHEIVFENIARDDYERYYAGHVEYGHYSKNRKSYVPARPFMRPALYAVSKASTGELGDALADLVGGIFNRGRKQTGYQGVQRMTFGKSLGPQYHKTLPSEWVKNTIEERGGISREGLNTMSERLSLIRGKGGYYQGRIRERDANLRPDGTNFRRTALDKGTPSKKQTVKEEKTKKSKFVPAKGSALDVRTKKAQRKAKRKKYKGKAKRQKEFGQKISRSKPLVDSHGNKYIIVNGRVLYI